MPTLHVAAGLALLAAFACGDDAGPGPTISGIRLDTIATGLFSPVHLTAPAGDPRLYVVEQRGRIRVIEDRAVRAEPFLDIRVKVRSGGEQGLLSVAFHPSYAQNGYLYVNYTDLNGDTRVERYTATGERTVADPASAKLILFVAQPYANHNGGQNAFGPDGMLYIGLGDGGSGGDPHGNGQRLTTLLGKILRVDVDHGDPYAIPADNPYAGRTDALPEIWASGLRNPWRFSFDRAGGDLYLADVGQGAWEEIDVGRTSLTRGANYGWSVMEGTHCYAASPCSAAGLTPPVLEYDHAGGACSVTGGVVYRGAAIPSLQGHYFYSDYCAGFLRSFAWTGAAAANRREWATDLGNVTSFGEDARGEVYVLTASGVVMRLAPPR